MRDVLGPGTTLGYCTNVHAGITLDQTLANLREHAAGVRDRMGVSELGIGAWLSQPAAQTAATPEGDERLRGTLAELGLTPFTFNAFPYGDFHQPVVKHAVYEPTWTDPNRLHYTIQIADLLASWLTPGAEGSISTLPLGWPNPDEPIAAHVPPLIQLAQSLAEIEAKRGCLIHVNLEPEPGCILDTAEDVVRFFTDHLLPAAGDCDVARYLRVCHDVCHSAVMGEDQSHVWAHYRAAGIRVGKVQVSNAVEVDFEAMSPKDRLSARDELAAFAEDRYLHQTMVRHDDGRQTFYEDLPLALQAVTDTPEPGPRGRWRVHFHVPLHVERFGMIGTTQREIGACLRAIRSEDQTHHFEAETYAWGVLPDALRVETLADGIAEELRWLIAQKAELDLAPRGRGGD